MNITINSLKYADPDETVIEVNWGASIWETIREPVEEVLDADGNVTTAADEGEVYSAAVSGTQEFKRNESSPEFVSYDDLTEATVMQWLEDALDLTELENKLAGFIAEQKNPVVEKGLPWEAVA
jgi:hypothetical protein